MSTSTTRSQQRSSTTISPFRSRKSPLPSPTTTTSSSSSIDRLAQPKSRPITPKSRPTTPSARPSLKVSLPSTTSFSKMMMINSPSSTTTTPTTTTNTTTEKAADFINKPKEENVTVTVRFRPLSAREINKGDEIAWYADGDYTVRNEFNSSIGYGFDRVFGPATTTRHVYDVAAQHVVSGAMGGINGTVFAYGVTSSGKTHTMHGEQKSPGIIPLAVKDVFGIIQETPGREFLLRVSYLEIYNEVINDLLDPIGQNLRIREDAQGTYVEGIKEEVVLSPAHALSLIASGEEHRHVGSNNFNLLSSRSHTIFTLTIESSPRGENQGEEDVTLSQLNLIDLAGSESSKTETTGLRRKEGSYINKSLLTLGTVISKLTDGKATHVPYRDSKLTRLLQSSLSGHGRVSIICTVTPASSNTEETHNTLKFAHRSKHVEIKASQNKIIDEKSLIKKYQGEISSLKHELQQLKQGMMEKPYLIAPRQEDLVNLKLQLEAGQVKLQSRLEEEEQAKAALMGRIQRLTKLILVSTKNTISSSIAEKPGHRRRHSFGEDELAYLPDRKREYLIDEDAASLDSEFSLEGRYDTTSIDDLVKDDKRNRKRGMLSWFKPRRPESLSGLSVSVDSESSSPTSSLQASQKKILLSEKNGRRKSVNTRADDPSLIESTQAGDLFSATVRGHHLSLTGSTITDQMDLLGEQVKMLAGEVAFCTSSLKRLSEQAASNPGNSHLQEQMQKLKDEISEKKLQMRVLEKRMIGSIETNPLTSKDIEMSQALYKLATQLNQKTFELEIKSADNRILQEQLEMKISENAEMQETILLLRQQLDSLMDKSSKHAYDDIAPKNHFEDPSRDNNRWNDGFGSHEAYVDGYTPTSVISLNGIFSQEGSKGCNSDRSSNSQVLVQATELENLKQENVRLTEEKDGLEIHGQKLAEEASYAKELASAAAVELRSLAEEVTKLSFDNAKLTGDLAAVKESGICKGNCCHSCTLTDGKQTHNFSILPDTCPRKPEDGILVEELQKELVGRCQREASLEAALCGRDQRESELLKQLAEVKQHEEALENDLANMWVLVSNMRNNGGPEELSFKEAHTSNIIRTGENTFPESYHRSTKLPNVDDICDNIDGLSTLEEVRLGFEIEKKRCKELESIISRLKSEDLFGLDISTLEELQDLHVEAITKICHAKVLNS
ncbi:Kinesin-like protein kin-7e protein [Thalictrum thalictroides]|uniref:Kinesin-like protein kin-7e protein n=1 Tax=Thalictrum thalictroides TaxID=46969 RepID=A0A7J6VCW2_THATH|nr:Kinesin-like protein kin-7e protein [Thalictrum thalictroides]